MKQISLLFLLSAPIAAQAATCPTGYITVDMPDVELAASCATGYTSAGTIDDCNTGAGVCAVTSQCDAGYYLKNGACSKCNSSDYACDPYYCPGDDNRYACPTGAETVANGADYHKALTGGKDEWLGFGSLYQCSTTGSLITNCVIHIRFKGVGGTYRFNCAYNPDTGAYYGAWCSDVGWYIADDGYYLSGFSIKDGNTDKYKGVKACTNLPANAHYTGPGTPDDPVTSGGKTDYNDCPWECDAGYGLHDGKCEPLCAAGATMLHVGPHTFNLYPDDACDRPAVHIGLPNGTCCAHLVKGEGTDALHVRYNGTVYHTTN